MENKKRARVKSVRITEELIIDIISRVPVADLMRFACVSKAWYSLFHTDPYFCGLQMERTASLDRQFVLIEKVDESPYPSLPYHQHLIDLDSIEDETINLREIHNPFQDRDAYVIASSQGLLVFEQRLTEKMAVSNPATRKHLIVPANPAGDADADFCGFGYDRVHDCYKLITEIKRSASQTYELMVYDINNDMWSHYDWKDKRPYTCLQCWDTICVDGVQYWCLVRSMTPAREMLYVICFVLATGEFHKVETPDFGEVKYYPRMGVLDGRLCLVVIGLENESHEAWMNASLEVWMIDVECDSNSSKAYSWRWTKLLSLSNPRAMLPPPYDVQKCLSMIPKCFSPCKTKILFVVGQRTLFWYDRVKHQFRKLNDAPANNGFTNAMSYTPSLVGVGIF